MFYKLENIKNQLSPFLYLFTIISTTGLIDFGQRTHFCIVYQKIRVIKKFKTFCLFLIYFPFKHKRRILYEETFINKKGIE